MNAPKPLPPCPVCGVPASETVLGSPGYYMNASIQCWSQDVSGPHVIRVQAKTLRAAREMWRRLAGGRK